MLTCRYNSFIKEFLRVCSAVQLNTVHFKTQSVLKHSSDERKSPLKAYVQLPRQQKRMVLCFSATAMWSLPQSQAMICYVQLFKKSFFAWQKLEGRLSTPCSSAALNFPVLFTGRRALISIVGYWSVHFITISYMIMYDKLDYLSYIINLEGGKNGKYI